MGSWKSFNHTLASLSPALSGVLHVHVTSNDVCRIPGVPFDYRWLSVRSLHIAPWGKGVSGTL